jgi:hypothetical protein
MAFLLASSYSHLSLDQPNIFYTIFETTFQTRSPIFKNLCQSKALVTKENQTCSGNFPNSQTL